MAGWYCAMAASIAASSSAKSAVSGTPWKARPCNCALMAYMTKPGTGATMLAPGMSHAIASRLINSSEPLPSISDQPVGGAAWRCSAAFSSSTRAPG